MRTQKQHNKAKNKNQTTSRLYDILVDLTRKPGRSLNEIALLSADVPIRANKPFALPRCLHFGLWRKVQRLILSKSRFERQSLNP